MSQSLIEERQSRILTILNDDFSVYAILGAEPEDDNDEEEEGNNEEEGEGKSGSETEVKPRTYSAEEYAALEAKMKAADQNRSKLQQRVDEIDNANKSELEKAQAKLAEAEARAEAAEKTAHEAKIGREFLKFPGYNWHDPETALALVDLDSIEIDPESGKVKGMKEAVEKLAKAKPFLLKSKDDNKNGEKENNGGNPSGHSPDGRRVVKQERREELAKKYRL